MVILDIAHPGKYLGHQVDMLGMKDLVVSIHVTVCDVSFAGIDM